MISVALRLETHGYFQDTARLLQRLIELAKSNWQVAIYPA